MARLTLRFRDNLINQYNLDKDVLICGRDPDCDIHIDSLAIAPRHLEFRMDNKAWTVRDLSEGLGVKINDQSIAQQQLKNRDQISIGKHTLEFTQDSDEQTAFAPPAEQEPRQSGWLQVMSGDMVGKTIRLKHGLTDTGKLGMKPALISRRNDGYYISPLDDDIKISIDGHAIQGQTSKLEDGSIIQIANISMQFYLQSE